MGRHKIPDNLDTFSKMLKWLLQQNDYKPPHVVVKSEPYQGSNPLMKASEGLDTSKGGICQGMALQWIKYKKADESDTFRKEVAENWANFRRSQTFMMAMSHEIQSKTAELKKKVAAHAVENKSHEKEMAYAQEKGAIATFKNMIWTPASQFTLDTKSKNISYEGDKLHKEVTKNSTDADEKSKQARHREVYGVEGNKVVVLGKGIPLDLIVSELNKDISNCPAFYVVDMINPARRNSGHAFAIYHSSSDCAFMDANGCELEFDTQATMHEFIIDYLQIYERFKYAEHKARIFRFD